MRAFHNASKAALVVAAAALVLTGCATDAGGGDSSERPDGVPAAGESRHIDEILERGTIRVGVLAEFPWLVLDKEGTDNYRGPSWTLANHYADALGVELEVVPVSNDTKVPLVQQGGVDITIGPLNETDERRKVIDFVTYSQSSACLYGLKTNPRVAAVETVADLEAASEMNIAYYVGQPFGPWLAEDFPNAEIRSVQGSGSDAPIEELLSGRADLVPADAAKAPKLAGEYGDIVSVPRNCAESNLMPTPVGHGVSKDDPVFRDFLTAIAEEHADEVRQVELDLVAEFMSALDS
ncbi:substrate-binding periplasmic protein [Ruicaihuangia caeni]|uniref:Transporter substrate-binding domain-containing protein n=1 Tax=Ruicaihuangia caeni TaxID=3042517 RepID=A0AAW6T6G9_9MICO|nr:transporter substrate-binding domain-containing protein [Klugiella sp. YN-L-19]MDI2099425.1 transporter substrate-binding domain-containing protein [Klugiella sp. YN-L-19]